MSIAIVPDELPSLVAIEPAEVWEAQTTAGEAGPVPAPAVPTLDSTGRRPALAVAGVGTLAPPTVSGAGDTLEFQTIAPGHIGSAGFAWRYTVRAGAAASEDLRGCDLPNVLVAHRPGGWANATTIRTHPKAVALPSGRIVATFALKASSGATTWSVGVKTFDPDTQSWSADTTVVSGLSNTHNPWPCICRVDEPRLPDIDGVLLLAYWRVDDLTNTSQVVVYASRDDGDTWSLWRRDVLDAAVDSDVSTGYDLGRLDIAYHLGQVCLVAGLEDNNAGGILSQVWQWASGDLAQTFTIRVNATGADAPRAFPVLCVQGGKLYLGYVEQLATGTTGQGRIRELGSAWQPFTETADHLIAGGQKIGVAGGATRIVSAGDLALCPFPVGRILCLARAYVSSTWYGLATVTDPQRTDFPGYTETYLASTWFDDGQATQTERPQDFCVVPWRGAYVCLTRLDTGSGTLFNSQWTHLQLGGYSTITHPPDRAAWAERARDAWSSVTVPTAAPSAQGWTTTGAGTLSLVASITWMRHTTAAAQLYHTRTPLGSPSATTELRASMRVRISSGATVMSRAVMLGIRQSDGATFGYNVELRFTQTEIQLYDLAGLAAIATVSADVASGVEVLLAQQGANCYAWYRPLSDLYQDREWTEIGNSSTLTDDAGALGGSTVVFGNRTTDTVTADYSTVRYALSTLTGWAVGFSAPDDLWGRLYDESPTYVAAGASVVAAGGPALAGDVVTVTGDAGFPVRHVLPIGNAASTPRVRGGDFPSPADGWRSTATSGRIAFRAPTGLGWSFTRGVLVVHVERPNFATADVAYYASGTWNSLGTLDCRGAAVGLPYVRSGATLRVDTAAGGFPATVTLLEADELAGGYVDLGSSKVRPILTNTGGAWAKTGLERLPTITMDPSTLDGTEASSGTLTIRYPRATFYVRRSAVLDCSGLSLSWGSAQTTYEGDIRAGVVAFGEAWPTDIPPDWGAELGIQTAGVFEELQTGQRIAAAYRQNRGVVRLPYAAAMPIPTSSPTYQTYAVSGGLVVAAAGSYGGDLMGLISRVKGSRDPVVYVPGIVSGTAGGASLVGRLAGFYGRIVAEEQVRTLAAGTLATPALSLGVVELEAEL